MLSLLLGKFMNNNISHLIDWCQLTHQFGNPLAIEQLINCLHYRAWIKCDKGQWNITYKWLGLVLLVIVF